MIFWKPTRGEDGDLKNSDNNVSIIHKLEMKDCTLWFIRFSMDCSQKACIVLNKYISNDIFLKRFYNNFQLLFQILALGNQTGKLFVWDLDVSEPSSIRSITLTHPRCNTTVRQTSLSRDGSILLSVCDDGTIWRWDKVPP